MRRHMRWCRVGIALLAAALSIHAQPESDKIIRIQTLNVRDILYVLTGGGANSLALMRDDGVVLIDSKAPGWGPSVLRTIGGVTDQPVKLIINTTSDLDHTGGKAEIPTAADIVAQENTKANMAAMDAFRGSKAKSLPNKTVSSRMSLLDGQDRIDLYYFGAAHTNGDLIVVFPEKHLAYLGDLFPSKAAPVIDTAHGGSAVEFPKTLARAAAEITGVTRVVAGHYAAPVDPTDVKYADMAQTMRWSDLVEYAAFNRDFLAAVQAAMQAGRNADDAAANLHLPEKYRSYDMQQAKANVWAIYQELKK
jgi:cyclase